VTFYLWRLPLFFLMEFWGSCSRSKWSQISRPLSDDLVIPVHFEVAQGTLPVLPWSTTPCAPQNSCWSSANRVSQVNSMMLLGETSELSFEPAIEVRSNRSLRDVPSGVTKKCVNADLNANHCDEYRRWCSLRRCGWSTGEGRTVRDLG
jgi:hypothetical protein